MLKCRKFYEKLSIYFGISGLSFYIKFDKQLPLKAKLSMLSVSRANQFFFTHMLNLLTKGFPTRFQTKFKHQNTLNGFYYNNN